MRRDRTPDLEQKITARMKRIDGLTPKQREIVHEHGWRIVQCFLERGITDPKHMTAIINTILSEYRRPRGERE